MNILEGMRWGEKQLLAKKVDNPRFDADILLAGILKVSRDRLYLERDRLLKQNEETAFREWISRRSEHEPLQYILQRQEFMGLVFYVDERVLIPRADSEILVEKWLELVHLDEARGLKPNTKVADLCTGSGALAISMAHYFSGSKVVGTDLSPDALAVARQNGVNLGVAVEWRQGDFTAPIREEKWDWIVSNPPYVSRDDYLLCAPEILREPSMAFLGGQDGLEFYRRLAEEAGFLLNQEGKILLEIGWDQAESVGEIFQKRGFATQVFPDLAGRDRVILAR
ncbi:peptide chain release factor N(5)-glutamine methyltransferase [Desulfosporosinus sp. PR]|uniref:peptide chain release factor N(5)-glutamine methyltransferase n=1 Tax=Candidatus Desulfosporosinus nitrosoreducens TaxID=3401928 RepID=UPI0027EA605B|nr:peptide chain release factor N(5)-glutamine methyltransferase [Desulfosporosinus sp. PR]MDQ7093016.1 peptide chain release factor N(5)-glutamine methyltransferase [Desulfosporosinus sp. PR]